MKHLLAASVAAAVFATWAPSALADETSSQDARVVEKKATTLPVTTVYGRAARPTAAIEVSRVRMTLPATTPTLSGASKITDAAKKDPF
jgi:hypothetical protein